MKSVSRDAILIGDLQGLFLVYSTHGHSIQSIEDELNVRFEKLGYPFDLMYEGYSEEMKIKGLLYRNQNSVYYLKASEAPFLINIANTEENWTNYVQDLIEENNLRRVEIITNFDEPGVWGPNAWRMIRFTGIQRPVIERGIINWGRKKLPISSWDGEK